MLLVAAIGLVIAVVIGVAAVIGTDVMNREPGSWYSGIKEWQPLLGAVLGFLGAAGVLVLSNELQSNRAAAESIRAENAIGYGLALETESLSGGLVTGLNINGLITAAVNPDYTRVCTEYIATLQRVLIGKTVVYDAVLGHLVDFGDQNLSVFVRFYSLYGDLLQEVGTFDTRQCQLNGESEVGYLKGKLEGVLAVYDSIARTYGTAVQAVTPAAAPETTPPPTPATTTPPQPATPPPVPGTTSP